jgi:hypothetical protein
LFGLTSVLAAFLAIAAVSPAYPQDLCTDAHMKQMDGMIAKMPDAAKKKEATTALLAGLVEPEINQ